MKRKGFTLIELLAVIVILAIIALIATPIILGVIEKSKMSAFKSSVSGIVDSLELDIYNKNITNNYTLTDGVLKNTTTDQIIPVKGGNGLNGEIKVRKDGTIIYAINNGEKCIIKRDGQTETEEFNSIEFCNMDVATNLIVNGYGEYGNNTNFSRFTYEDGAFVLAGSGQNNRTVNKFIKVDSEKKYYQSVDVKSNNIVSRYYIGLILYDIDKYDMQWCNSTAATETLTYLTKDLNDGDTKIYLNDLSKWNLNNSSTGIIAWNYTNSLGYTYPENTYSRNRWENLYATSGIDKTNNTITLNSEWNKGTIKSGTKISRLINGCAFHYGLRSYSTLTLEYQTFSTTISGLTNTDIHSFIYGTEYVRFLTLDNYNGVADSKTYYKNIVFREIEE